MKIKKIEVASFEEFLEMIGRGTDDLQDSETDKETDKDKEVQETLKRLDEQLDNLFEYNMQRLVRKMIDREFAEFKEVRAKSFELGGDLYHKTIEEFLKRDLTAEETALVDFAFMLAYTNGWYDHERCKNNDK
jgi:hypothetical protein